MRRLKPEVEKRILNAATQEFYDNGFEKARMRIIARKSNVAVGNIYRYFKNKEALFAKVVLPAFNKIVDLIESEPKVSIENKLDTDYILSTFTTISVTHPREIVIILDRYLGLKEYVLLDNLKYLIVNRIKKEVKDISSSFANTLTHLILKGTSHILQNNDPEDYELSINELYLFLFKDLEERVGNIK